ncbi:alpha-L-fucosidase [Thalassotalea crassostreae]|uniref:alpha-L-fucosidase n=1 Tax=Thalassotalea crassostreae TaxID=1763536 RepID=UPI000838B39F|nr:alpha-L-fucosidase [Thalassotalea crassostreae]
MIKAIKLPLSTLTIAVLSLSAPSALAEKTETIKADWDSIATKQIPEWLIDAKFGVYTHWGIYSVPAHGGPDYVRQMYSPKNRKGVYEYHTKKYGSLEEFGYTDFIPKFTAPKFNASEWVGLMNEAGAKFGGIALVHHDGFLLWDSKYSRWNSKNMGPKKDIYGEIAAEVAKYPDMKLAATFHHGRTFNYAYGELKDKGADASKINPKWELSDPELGDFFWKKGRDSEEQFNSDWYGKITEVVDTYKPDFIWFDGLSTSMKGGHPTEENVTKAISYYYNESAARDQDVVVANKLAANFNFPDHVGLKSYENGRDMPEHQPGYWLADRAIGYPWSYVNNKTYRDGPDYQVDSIIDFASRGGIMFLSLTPKGDGSIPEAEVEIMKGIGRWMKVNGEAIYGTRRYSVYGEGPTKVTKFVKIKGKEKVKWDHRKLGAKDVRFTQKDNTLYAIALGWPENGKLTIKTLNNDYAISSSDKIKNISLIGSDEKIEWKRDSKGLHIVYPEKQVGEFAYSFKIEVEGDLIVTEPDAEHIKKS